jgi:hypothetical protein
MKTYMVLVPLSKIRTVDSSTWAYCYIYYYYNIKLSLCLTK